MTLTDDEVDAIRNTVPGAVPSSAIGIQRDLVRAGFAAGRAAIPREPTLQERHEAIRLLRYVLETNDDTEAREFLAHIDAAQEGKP